MVLAEITNKSWVTDPKARRAIKVSDDPSSPSSLAPRTITSLFDERVAKHKGTDKAAFHQKQNGAYRPYSWDEFGSMANAVAKALLAENLTRYAGVCVLGFNSPEWFAAEIGCMKAGGIIAGIYTTNQAPAAAYVAENCEAEVVFCEGPAQVAKFISEAANLPRLKRIVMWGAPKAELPAHALTTTWDDFLASGSAVPDSRLAEVEADTTPENCCALIYTSGTTGNPKGVMISHDNFYWTAKTAAIDHIGFSEKDVIISFLPLSHVAAQMIDVCIPIVSGCTVYFAQPDALKGSLGATLKEVRPTIFLGVPRVWEKIQAKMLDVGRANSGTKKAIGAWAKSKGLEGGYNDQRGVGKPWGTFVANKLVFSKVREALGLGRAHYTASSAAPISKDTLEYFLSLGIPLYEIYGSSETTGPIVVSRSGLYRTGAAGPLFPDCEAKLINKDKDGNGEIIARGRHIFMGYLHNEAKTVEAIDDDGFYHSGDVGRFDDAGYFTITGRIKEILITAGGENVAPVLIEDQLKHFMPFVSNAMVIGDRKKFLSVVLSFKCVVDLDTGIFSDKLDDAGLREIEVLGSSAKTTSEAAADPLVQAAIKAAIEEANKKAISKAQHVKLFRIIPTDFSLPGGELTPTMKLKRSVATEKYQSLVDEMYA